MTPDNWMAGRANRKAICRALKIDPASDCVAYAVLPFRLMRDDEGNTVIGAAVGIWRSFNPRFWTADDISDVILWNPITNALHASDPLIIPDMPEPRLTVYADGFAFFRAWADRRAAIFAGIREARLHRNVASAEPRDSGIPGALVIADLNKIAWASLGASVLVAGPGVDGAKLNKAIIRSAHLPRVESLAA